MFRNREIAKTMEFNFIIAIRVIVFPKESYSPFISYLFFILGHSRKLIHKVSRLFDLAKLSPRETFFPQSIIIQILSKNQHVLKTLIIHLV